MEDGVQGSSHDGGDRRPCNRELSSTGLACIGPQPAPQATREVEECRMARSLARDAEEFAQLILRTVERLGRDGDWVPAGQALEHTLAEHPDHAYVAQLRAKPARRIALSTITERVRAAEFPHLERRKAGIRRNAPVFYRIARPNPALNFNLPYEIAPSHPLLVRRRVAKAKPVSARRAALTAAPPKSPWRRRMLLRPTVAPGGQVAHWPPRLFWARLSAAIAAFAVGRPRR
jgi:hypothetical protein